MRLNKPVGIYLLWFPTAWAFALAYSNHPPLLLLVWFALGTITMRSAGCIINDIADRDFDIHVQRTKARPLTTNAITLKAALITLFLLLSIALIILLQLPSKCFLGAIPAVVLTGIYPFCKRFLATPQLVLSLAFASSIPMVALASNTSWDASWSLLVILTILWVFTYDTQYALADIKDDQKIGIHSSAIFFKDKVKLIIYFLQTVLHCIWILIAYMHNFSGIFYYGWCAAWLFWIYQYFLLKQNQPLNAFKNNTWYGLWMWVILLLGIIST